MALAACAIVLGVAIAGLVIVHGHLDAVIAVETAEITDREVFVMSHRRYTRLTTVQWLAALAYLPITIAAWRNVDQRDKTTVRDEP